MKTETLYEGNFIKNAIKNTKAFFKDKTKAIKRNAKRIFRQFKKDFLGSKNPGNFKAGKLIAFTYDAKFKDGTVWDKKPLVICLGWSRNPKFAKKNFYGLNIHHLPLKDRIHVASFFLELNKKRNGNLMYDDIKPFMSKFGKSPVLRQYIYNRVGSRVIEMPAEHYLTAAAIPSEVIIRG